MHNDGWATDSYGAPARSVVIPRSTRPGTGSRSAPPWPSTRTSGWSRCAVTCRARSCTCSTARACGHSRPGDCRTGPRSPGKKPWENLCAGAYFYLDPDDRAVVATTDRHILELATSDAGGRPGLRVTRDFPVAGAVPRDGLPGGVDAGLDGSDLVRHPGGPGRHRRPVDGSGGRACARGGGGQLARGGRGRRVRRHGGRALPDGRRTSRGVHDVDWRAAYDRGSEQKPGQLSRGSGTTPTVLAGWTGGHHRQRGPPHERGVLRHRTGRKVCKAPVFGRGRAPPRTRWCRWARAASSWRTTTATPVRQSTLLGRATSRAGPRRPRRRAMPRRVDQLGDRTDVGAEVVSRQRAGLRLHEAPDLVGRVPRGTSPRSTYAPAAPPSASAPASAP